MPRSSISATSSGRQRAALKAGTRPHRHHSHIRSIFTPSYWGGHAAHDPGFLNCHGGQLRSHRSRAPTMPRAGPMRYPPANQMRRRCPSSAAKAPSTGARVAVLAKPCPRTCRTTLPAAFMEGGVAVLHGMSEGIAGSRGNRRRRLEVWPRTDQCWRQMWPVRPRILSEAESKQALPPSGLGVHQFCVGAIGRKSVMRGAAPNDSIRWRSRATGVAPLRVKAGPVASTSPTKCSSSTEARDAGRRHRVPWRKK